MVRCPSRLLRRVLVKDGTLDVVKVVEVVKVQFKVV
jgi:hypothetical protein